MQENINTQIQSIFMFYIMAREIHFPAEFSSNCNQTHLSMLLSVFRIIRKSQVAEFDQGRS